MEEVVIITVLEYIIVNDKIYEFRNNKLEKI